MRWRIFDKRVILSPLVNQPISSLTIVLLPFRLSHELGTGGDISRHVDDVLIGNVVEARNKKPVPALGNLEPCDPIGVGKRSIGMQQDVSPRYGSLLFAIECLDLHLMIGRADDLDRENDCALRMGYARIETENPRLPPMVSKRQRGFGFHFRKIKGAGSGPSVLTQVSATDLCTLVIENAQLHVREIAPDRALAPDREPEAFTRRDRGRHTPYADVGRVRLCHERELGRGRFVQRLVLCPHYGPADLYPYPERRPQRHLARHDSFAVALHELGACELGIVISPDRDTPSLEVASVPAIEPDSDGQLGSRVNLMRGLLDRACGRPVRPRRSCRHGGARNHQADGSWAAFVPAI